MEAVATTTKQLTLKEALELGNREGRPKGWRARDLGCDKLRKWAEKKKLYALDLAEFKGVRSAFEPDFLRHNNRGKDNNFKPSGKKTPPALSIEYFAYAWGITERTVYTHMKKPLDEIEKPKPLNCVNKSVIRDRAAALAHYTPRRLFIYDYVRRKKEEVVGLAYTRTVLNEMIRTWTEEAKGLWACISSTDKEIWEFKAREHDAQHPHVIGWILESLRSDPSKSYEAVAADIGFWCSENTIHRFIASYDDNDEGSNTFLSYRVLHSSVRKDFEDTLSGMKRKANEVDE